MLSELSRCPICDRGFSMASNMSKHIESHSDSKPYAWVFSNLVFWPTIHWFLFPYSCETCGQFCKTPRSLKFHIICFHKTEMKIKCPDCDKSFVNKSYLKMHQQYHTGDKKFTVIFLIIFYLFLVGKSTQSRPESFSKITVHNLKPKNFTKFC
jgi:uncharacterized Zn-finger protein